MANDGKYLTVEGGLPKQELGASAGGAGDANKIPKLDASGRFPQSMMPVGLGADTATINATEALAAGDFVNVHATGVRKADATTPGKEADGFVLAAFATGAAALVYFEGTNTALTGMTAGARQFLATTAGGRTETPPTGSGQVTQLIGKAISATAMSFEPREPVTLA